MWTAAIPTKQFDLEISFLVKKKQLGNIIDRCIRVHGTARTAEVLDRIKAQGLKYSTRSGLTVAVVDAVIPPEKADIIAEADKKVLDIRRQYDRGFISDDVRYERVVKTWNEATQKVRDSSPGDLQGRQPHLYDGGLRSPRRHEPRPSAGWYAWSGSRTPPVVPSKSPSSPTTVKV